MDPFHFESPSQEVIFGRGRLADLADSFEIYGWQRVMLCTSPSLARYGFVEALRGDLGESLLGVYDRVQAHVQEAQLSEARAIAEANHPDAIIGLGGGSSVGLAKALSLELSDGRSMVPDRANASAAAPNVPVVAIPSTYAGSEMTAIYGVTRIEGDRKRKVTGYDPRILPRLVLYDPEVSLNLPPETTASSGVNAFAHCVEALYSPARNPLATAAARSGVEHITRALPRCTRQGSDLEARSDMLIGAHLAAVTLSLTTMGLHHGLCHVLGGSAGVPHGIANGLILPHAMRFNLETAAPQLALVAGSMGLVDGEAEVRAAAEAAVEGVFEFIGRLGLPQRLRDVGVREADLPHLADVALDSRAVQRNVRPVREPGQVEAVLRAAW